MEDTIDISSVTNKYVDLVHSWSNRNSFENGESYVRTMSDSDDSSKNAASTEWVNNFFNNKIPTTPTINVPLLTPMWFDHTVISNAWVRSENERTTDNDYAWLSGKTYDSIYAHLVSDLKDATSTSETISGVSVTFKIAEDGHKIIESNQDTGTDDTIFDNTGVAWYYVVDTKNVRFKLPRTRYGFQGLKNSESEYKQVGKYDNPGLPNITGSFGGMDAYVNAPSSYGAFSHFTSSHCWSNVGSSGYNLFVTMDASRSNSIYGSADTVQPPATEMYLYFSTGDESAAGVGSGVGGGVIDGTLLKDMTAVTVAADSTSFSYTVANDCLLYIETTGTDIEGWGMENKDYLDVYVNDGVAGRLCEYVVSESSSNTDYPTCSIPVKRGSIITIKGDGLHKCFNSGNAIVNFYEYALNSTAPQIAMPDWQTTKSVSISSGEQVTENGYIICIPTHVWTSVSSNFYFYVNNICVFDGGRETTNYHDNQRTVVPVAKNDTITYTQTHDGVYSLSAMFYPCKTVQQSSPVVYVTKREHGNYATIFSEDTTYSIGGYVKTISGGTIKYYRITSAGKGSAAQKTEVEIADVPTWCYTLYSDGYCEQSGKVKYFASSGSNVITVNMKKEFIDTTYVLILNAASNAPSDTGHLINENTSSRTTSSFGFTVVDVNGSTADSWNCWEAKGFTY